MPSSKSSTWPPRMPPGVKSSVPATMPVQAMAGRRRSGRGAEQHHQVEAAGLPRFERGAMGDERPGGEGEQLVEQEEREQVAGECDPHGRSDGERKADIEQRLAWRLLGPHIADRVDRVDDPQPGGDRGEEHAERLDGEDNGKARDHGPYGERRGGAAKHRREQPEHGDEEKHGAEDGDALAQVGTPGEERNEQRRRGRDEERERDQRRGAHWMPPIRATAARCAMPAVSVVSMPNQTVAKARIQIGISISAGASRTWASALAGSRK